MDRTGLARSAMSAVLSLRKERFTAAKWRDGMKSLNMKATLMFTREKHWRLGWMACVDFFFFSGFAFKDTYTVSAFSFLRLYLDVSFIATRCTKAALHCMTIVEYRVF